MIRVSVLYPENEGTRFDWAYYLGSHIPMVKRQLGVALKEISIEHGLTGIAPGSPPTFVAMVHLSFDSVDTFHDAFNPNAAQIMGDIPNYTAIEPVIQICEVKSAQQG